MGFSPKILQNKKKTHPNARFIPCLTIGNSPSLRLWLSIGLRHLDGGADSAPNGAPQKPNVGSSLKNFVLTLHGSTKIYQILFTYV